MSCLDCGAPTLTDLCALCAEVAVVVCGSEDVRVALLRGAVTA